MVELQQYNGEIMGIYSYAIQDVGLGTSTAKTQLSGDQSGNAKSWTLPAECRGLLAVIPTLYQTTPTANQTAVCSLKIESDDLGIKDYEVLAIPIGSNVATTNVGLADPQRMAKYPLFYRTEGGEAVNFFGIPQTANAVAPNMGATVWWTDDPNVVRRDKPYRAKIGGTAGGAGAGTSTGTATGAVTGATITVSGAQQRTIRGLYGVISATTLAASKPIAGFFQFIAGELKFTQSFNAEPVQGELGTAQAFAHLSRIDEIAVPLRAPSTIATQLNVTAAPSTAGNFYNGILYQDTGRSSISPN